MEWIWGHIVFFVVASIFAWTRKQHAKPMGRCFQMSYPWTIKALGSAGFLLISAFVYAVATTPAERESALPIAVPVWLITFLGLVHCWTHEIWFDEEFIYATSALSGSKKLGWREIHLVTRFFSGHVIRDSHRRRIVVNDYLNGSTHLVALALAQVAENSHELDEQ